MANYKLELAIRRNTGKQICEQVAAELAFRLGRPQNSIDFVDLITTDALYSKFDDCWQRTSMQLVPYFDRSWTTKSEIEEILHRVSSRIKPISMLMFHEQSDLCGALKTDARELFASAMNFIEMDGPTLMSSSEDGSCGFLANLTSLKNESNISSVFEVRVWGSQFLNTFSSVIST